MRLRNQWVSVDPRDWRARNDMTINVGLGTGGKSEQLAHMMTILGLQKEAMAAGLTNLVDAGKIYNAAKEITKLVGFKDPDRFFSDPGSQPAPQPQPDPKMIELQGKMEIEKTQAQADMATTQQKMQSDAALAERKFQHDAQLEIQRFELDRQMKLLDMESQREKHALDIAAKRENHAMSVQHMQQKAAAAAQPENAQ